MAPISSNFPLQVNDTVLTDVQGGGQIASPSDISPPYPSQSSISLPAGNKHKREGIHIHSKLYMFIWKVEEEPQLSYQQIKSLLWNILDRHDVSEPDEPQLLAAQCT